MHVRFSAAVLCLALTSLSTALQAQGTTSSLDGARLSATSGASQPVVGYIPQVFADPLLPVGEPSPTETLSLKMALDLYSSQSDRFDFSSLETFAAALPHSSWTPSLLIGMGLSWYDQGRYSRALESYRQAFESTRMSYSAGARELHFLSGALYAKMLARVGKRDELDAFFASEVAAKPTGGNAVELIAQAKGGLWNMHQRPELSFRCGSMALYNVAQIEPNPKLLPNLLLNANSPTTGFSLTELVTLGRQAGHPVKAVRRTSPDASLIVPAVVHWKIGHYAAIVERSGDRFMIDDPTFGEGRRTLMTPAALAEESSGYFLVANDTILPTGWREVGADEADQIRGRGQSAEGVPQATTTNDKKCPDCEEGNNPRMAGYSFTAMLVSLNISDTPLQYSPPLGYAHDFTVTYNEREMQPGSYAFGCFSASWSMNWLSWITVKNATSETADPGDVDVSMPSGGAYTFKKDTFTAGSTVLVEGKNETSISYQSKYQRDTHIRLVRNGVVRGKKAPAYVLNYPDGSKVEYGRVADLGTERRYFMSRRIDAQGNISRLVYDQNFRITQIVTEIPDGSTPRQEISSFGYDSDPAAFYNNPYLITKITTPDARSARFTYDQHGTRLVASTDSVGMSSIFEYGDAARASRITKLHTPYGTTSFRFGESPDMLAITRYRWIEATDAGGATERIEFSDGRGSATAALTGIPDQLSATELPAMKLYNSHANQRTTFYWPKRAYALTSFASATTDAQRNQPGSVADYAKADLTHWLIEQTAAATSRLPEWEKSAGENYVFYNYQKSSPIAAFENWSAPVILDEIRYAPTADESGLVSVIGRLVPDPAGGSTPVSQIERFAYNAAGRLTRHRDAAGRETLYSYDSTLVNLSRVERMVTRGAALPADWTAYTLPTGWTTQLLASFTYDPLFPNLVQSQTDQSRNTTTYAYNSSGQLAAIGDGRGATTLRYSPSGASSAATATSVGYLTHIDGPLSGTQDQQIFEWQNGSLKTHTDESGYATTITARDGWLRPLQVSYPDGSESFDYEEAPHPDSPSDEEALPAGPTLQLPYNVPPLGPRLHRLASRTARDGQSYYYRYDKLARPTTVRDESGALMLKQSWCACGALEWFTDRKVQKTSFYYFDDGRLQKRVFPAVAGQPANELSYTYDIAGRPATMTNARGQVATYRLNIDDLPGAILYAAQTPPAYTTRSSFFTYDPLYPRLVRAEEKIAGGSTYTTESQLDYIYHPITPAATLGAGQLASVTTTLGTFVETRAYKYDAYGRLKNRTYSGREETYVYDAANRPLSKSVPVFGDFAYTFDGGSGRLKSLTRTGGLAVVYNYYPATQPNAQRLDNIQWKIAATSAAVTTHTYGYLSAASDADRPIQAWRIQSGTMDNKWLFDYAERPEQELVSAVQSGGPSQLSEVYSYGYDEAGNRRTEQTGTQVTTTEHNARNQATTRSGAGPLLIRAKVSPPPASGPWLNDTLTMQRESGQRGGFGDALASDTYRAFIDLPSGNQVIRIEARDGAGRAAVQHLRITVPAAPPVRTYVYDQDGNLTTINQDSSGTPVAIRSYAWDARNRLIAWGDGASPTAGSFVYDGEGHRVAEKSAAGTIIRYWMWEGATLLAEHDASRALTTRYYPEGYERVSGPGIGRYYYTRDHLGSIREIVDATNNVVTRYAYDPFGRRYQTTGSETSALGYTGHLYHQATGLWLTHFRAYDADQGKWLSRDPINESGGINLYSYTENNPINSTDLLGLDIYVIVNPKAVYQKGHLAFATYSPKGIIEYRSYGADGLTKASFKNGQELQAFLKEKNYTQAKVFKTKGKQDEAAVECVDKNFDDKGDQYRVVEHNCVDMVRSALKAAEVKNNNPDFIGPNEFFQELTGAGNAQDI